MREWELIARAATPEGTDLTLSRSGRAFLIRADGRGLMGSDQHGSEEALSTLGCARARGLEAPTVLIGGLGMGFTLRAALDVLPPEATVIVAELLEAVVTWNRGPIGHLAGHPLADGRAVVELGDVGATIARSPGRFDAILLDVDNGPVAMAQVGNGRLYGDEGLASAKAALREDGVLAVWSAWDDKKFEHRMRHAGFDLTVVHVRARLERGGPNHTLFIGTVGAPLGDLVTKTEGVGRPRPKQM